MASANCSVDENGVPTGCEVANTTSGNSGMWVGTSSSGMIQVKKGTGADAGKLNNFQWGAINNDTDLVLQERVNGKRAHSDLKFTFNNGGDEVSGSGEGTLETDPKPYNITIGSLSNKFFLLNTGSKGLILNDGNTQTHTLDIDFSSSTANEEKFTFILNAGKLDGKLTLKQAGTFKATLVDGITGQINNNGATAEITLSGTTIPASGTHGELVTKGGGTTTLTAGSATKISFKATGGAHKSFSATGGGKNKVTAEQAALTLAGGIIAGGKGKPSAGTNTITAKSLTLTNGDITVGGSGEGADGKAINNITIAGNITLNATDTASKKGYGDIVAYTFGENNITTQNGGNLTLKGSIVAGSSDLNNQNKKGATNILSIDGKITLDGKINSIPNITTGAILAQNGGENIVTAKDITLSSVLMANTGGSNTITISDNKSGAQKFILEGISGAKSITARSGGSNTIDAGVADLTLAGGILAGLRGGSDTITNEQGKNTITAKSLTLETNDIAVAGKGGSDETSTDYSLNQITAIGDGSTPNNGSITLKTGSIQSYFFGKNVIKAGSLELKAGSITAGDKGNANKTGAVNNITLTGTLALNGTASNAVGNIISSNSGLNKITTDSLAMVGSIEATTAGTNTITLKGETTQTSSISGHIVVDGENSANNFIIKGGTLTVTGVIGAVNNKGKNNFTLDSSAKAAGLTLNGTNNVIANFTALGEDAGAGKTNTLTLASSAVGTNSIGKLMLGSDEEGQSKTGLLTITNESTQALTITDFVSQDANNVLTINKGEVAITNALTENKSKFDLQGATLTLNNQDSGSGNTSSIIASLTTTGTNAINFNAGKTIINGEITAKAQTDKNTFTLTGTGDTGTSAIFNGVINGNGENNFTLDSKATSGDKTNLTLGAGGSTITSLTAIGGSADAQAMNTLTIDKGAIGTNEITTLNLGKQASDKGFLTITNNAIDNALKIGAFTNAGDQGNILIINKGAVEIANDLTNATGTNFTLDSQAADDKTNLTLKGTGNNTITKLTALSADDKAMNTLTIDAAANGANAITDLVLGSDSGTAGLLTIANSGSALEIKKLTANGTSTLELSTGKYKTIGELILEENSSLNFNATGIENDSGGQLTITKLTSKTDSKLNIGPASQITIDEELTGDYNDITLNGGGSTILTLNNKNGESTIKKLTTTGTGNTINLNANKTTFNAIAGSGTNNFKLTGTSVTTSAVFESAISGANNFTLDSSADMSHKTQLTLNSKDGNTITSFIALGGTQAEGNTLIINTDPSSTNIIENLVLGEKSGDKGFLTITNKTEETLTIGTFTNAGDATNTLTINQGEVAITTLEDENNNITLDSTKKATALILNGGTLNKLETKGTNGNTITFNSGTTTIKSGITAEQNVKNTINLGNATLTGAIKANNGGSNTIAIQDTSATIDGNLIQTGGSNNISFVADSQLESQTLHLKGVKNEITTLDLTRGSKNNVIDLAGGTGLKTEFRLLTIGNKTAGTGKLIDNKDTTLTFESHINPFAGEDATLGGENASDPTNTYGYAYSDRVVIHNGQGNTEQAKGTYKFNAYYAGMLTKEQLEGIKYTQNTGTETKDNIALFTVAKVGNQGVINLETSSKNDQPKSTTRSGFDAITTTLTQVETNEYGKKDGSGYFTYFINKVEVAKGGDGNGTGSEGDNSQIGHIIRDSNLMIQSMAVSAVNLYLANFNSLNKRMGELRDNAYSKGVWARTFIGSQSNDFGLSDRTGYFSLQAGFDGTIKTEKANNFIGVAISYSKNFGYSSSKNNARDLNNGVRTPELGIDSLNAQLVELALYNSYVSNEGWYNDTIGKFSYIQNSMSVKDQRGAHVGGINGAVGEFNTFALTLSNEVGYRAKLGEDKAWFIDPQAELAIGHINGVNFSLNHYRINQATATATASISSAINLRARAGASIGYDFKNFTQDKGIDAKVYVGAFYEMDYFHYTDGSQGIKYTTKLKDTREVKMLDTDHRAVLNVGTNLTIKDATRIYLDFEKSFGGKITTDYKINAGVRYSFGEALSEKGKEVLKDKESVESEAKAPLKLEEKDKQAKVEEKGEQDKAQG